MNRITIALFAVLASMAMCGSVTAEKARKLPAGAYIKSAKIEIISGDTVRYAGAMAMLDTLIMHYGPHAEGLYWLSQIEVDFVEKSSSPQSKQMHIEKILRYSDSLRQMCADPNVDAKNKKDCDKWVSIVDSLKVKYWGEFYNRGVEQLNASKEMANEKATATDSVTIAFAEKGMAANSDSAIQNLKVAIAVNPSDFRAYIAIGNVYDGMGKYEEALEWTKKGADKASDRSQLVIPIAIYYINLDKYCDAIPYFREYVSANPDDIATMYNLSICYSRCDQVDSAVGIYRAVLAKDSLHAESVCRLGEHYFTKSRVYSDSISAHSGEANNPKVKDWMSARDKAYDTASIWLKKGFGLKTDDVVVASQYALISSLLGRFDEAALGFKRLAELEPNTLDNWVSLGDTYVRTSSFKDAIEAYEKAEAISDANINMLETMQSIYHELGDAKNADRITAKLAKRK